MPVWSPNVVAQFQFSASACTLGKSNEQNGSGNRSVFDMAINKQCRRCLLKKKTIFWLRMHSSISDLECVDKLWWRNSANCVFLVCQSRIGNQKRIPFTSGSVVYGCGIISGRLVWFGDVTVMTSSGSRFPPGLRWSWFCTSSTLPIPPDVRFLSLLSPPCCCLRLRCVTKHVTMTTAAMTTTRTEHAITMIIRIRLFSDWMRSTMMNAASKPWGENKSNDRGKMG